MLKVENLSISFQTDEGMITPVQNVSFAVQAGRTLGIVGESGSGKSVSTKALMKLLPGNSQVSEGARMTYTDKAGREVRIDQLRPKGRDIRRLRGGEIGMIFQEPMASFSPVYTIGNQMIEAIRLHQKVTKKEARAQAIAMLDKVGISNPEGRVDQYPHEMSGGMRQRAMIALALAARPALLIADEPTTALDVTIQAQVLELMADLQRDLGMGMIFITHDLGVIAQVAQDVAVMYLGTIVESGPTADVIRNPRHPYTQGLLKAIPSLDALHDRLSPVPGDIPSPNERPTGCPFHTRCSQRLQGLCDRQLPPTVPLGPNLSVACWLETPEHRTGAEVDAQQQIKQQEPAQ
ncbi:ABC transporter ATP-binding protein [Phaeobacter sp. CNT1-3]|nr:ABC transporter ATP-binding protein [Phaeobacter sp. CNT1-3]